MGRMKLIARILIATLVVAAIGVATARALTVTAGGTAETTAATSGSTGSVSDAAATAAAAANRTRFDFTRIQSFSEWWQKPLLVLACILVLTFVALMYRRDSVELKRGVG